MEAKKKLYISGSISKLPLDEAKENFRRTKEALKEQVGEEYDIVSMMSVPHVETTWAEYLIRDLMFLKNCDAIAFQSNFEESHGALTEREFARGLGLKELYLDNNNKIKT